ncbi:hypothetical protein A2397_05340 [Candidatus Amesbacteria bacterium RIFOXYB1_FULL_44_23]|uniref:Phosphohydrolase n=1 Tax=Candidatus Amesbacteria bacterium RIFOXYB1_FULL_44_23 TaxID=1797263 RepID=A0A1F4ZQR1_9BACT|nr:MAG: hypothetical protein A2397_05340 [Candidatus Amesbacteria bacterium RIFOXYB1_FULL_44_23]
MITKDQALDLIRAHVKNENIVKHMLALGAVMAAFYDHLQPGDGSTKDEWYIAGLLHDGDYCEGVPHNMQGVTITQWAKDAGYQIPENVAHAMAAHNWSNTGVEPVSQMDWSIFCADSLTGLITACTLVLPTKKLADVKLESVLKKFKQPSFASGTRREDIQMCETKLNIPLDQFISVSLSAMQSASDQLGL